MPSVFLRKCNSSYDEIYIRYGCILYNVKLFFHKVLFIINKLIPPLLRDALLWWTHQTLLTRWGISRTLCLSSLSENSVLGKNPYGGRERGRRR